MTTTNNLTDLQPGSVWRHFATLCSIPRPSLHEAALRDHLIKWAEMRGIETAVDETGNLILRRAASPGCESLPGVVLQGHLDMVCQANAGTQHNFERDPINAVVRDGWVVAENTTLGADNGIGVALALAALEEPGLRHPPLEVLLTVNEESGMDGVRELAPATLRGTQLINLDTEEWGHFYLGCAGGVDVEVHHGCTQEEVPAGCTLWRLDVSGLCGGHSGIDINLGRGNAIKLLAEVLHGLAERGDLHLIELHGGTARNAIPREAYAVVALSGQDDAQVAAWVQQKHAEWRARFAAIDPNVTLMAQPLPREHASRAIAGTERAQLLNFLASAFNGVALMSEAFPGVVDTSSNLGVMSLKHGEFRTTFKVRSLHDARGKSVAAELVEHATSHGLRAWTEGGYPGWTPNPSSRLLALCQRVYTAQFGRPASLQVIHAGLECGLLAASHPQLDMISFGPDIRGAHAPGERVEIESVGRCWQLLKAALEALATAPA
ncbi:MAG TPA: aminoacyl-histidine dipeptidase [Gallionella sp.]|nr:aminoacyl-histidine dipeptidase [Gallionella sp.]